MKIEGKRIYLREWHDDDVNDLVEGLNNINVSKWLASVPFPYTIEEANDFLTYAKESNDNSKGYMFAIVLKESEKVIGGTEIVRINLKDGTAGGGIWINEKYHGKGYGTEAFKLRVEYAFNGLGLRRIENGFFPGNNSSKKMQEKLGFKEEGIRRKRFLCLATGEYVDEVITGLLKEEWEKI